MNSSDSGNTSPDGQGLGTSLAQVRAERAERGNGRVYHIKFTANDGHGGTCSNEIDVGIPIDNKSTAIDNGSLYDSTALGAGASGADQQSNLDETNTIFLPLVNQ